MKLYFEDSYGNRRLLGEPATHEESSKIYQKFCEDSLVFTILVILTDLVLAMELCGVKGSCSVFCL